MSTFDTVRLVCKHGGTFIKKNLPTIMTIGAGIGVGVTSYFAIKATPAAMEKIKEKEALDPDMTTLQKVAVAVPEYAPAIVAFAITEGLLLGANHINLKKIATISALYSALSADKKTKEKALKAAEEIIGKEKMDDIKKAVGVTKESVVATSEGMNDYEAEKLAEKIEYSKQGKNEVRPCRFNWTGQLFHNSYNGLYAGLLKASEQFRWPTAAERKEGRVGLVCINDLLHYIKCPACGAGDEYAFVCSGPNEELQWSITETTIDDKLGYEVYIWPDPTNDFTED